MSFDWQASCGDAGVVEQDIWVPWCPAPSSQPEPSSLLVRSWKQDFETSTLFIIKEFLSTVTLK